MHEEIVEEIYEQAQKTLSHTRWDGVDRNIEYFSKDPESKYFNNPKGEMDVVLYDFENQALKYIEVKTGRKHIGDGKRQLERAKDYFEDIGWDFYGDVYVEDIGRINF